MSYVGTPQWRGRIYTWTALVVLFTLVISHWATPTRADSPGYALQFNGSTNYVSLGDTGNLMGTNGWVSSMTISLWLRVTGQTPPNNFPPSGELIAGADTPRLFGINRAVYNGSDRIWLWNADSNGVDMLGVTFTPGEWMHIAMVHSNGMLYAYKNGVLVSSIPSGNTYVTDYNNGDGKLFLGGSGRTDQSLYFEGELDEVRFWNTALSEATIAAWWNREVTIDHPNWANLAAYYQMTDGAGTVLSDNSGHGRTGTLKGGMSDANWVLSGALGGALPTPTATYTPTFTPELPTPTPTDTPALPADTPTPTDTLALATDTPTFTPEPPTPTPTDTPVLPTDTPTLTLEPPTPTPTDTPTFTSEPPTATPTFTLEPPTPTPTFTLEPPTATPTFTPEPPTPTPTSTVAAGGFALEFDGSNDFVKLNETALIMAPGWQYTKSVSLWVRPMGPSPVCSHSDVAACDNIFGDRPRWWGIARGVINGQDRIWIFNADGSSGSFIDKIGVTYNPDEWVHIALVHSNGILRAYKDGVEVGSVASGMTQQPTTGAHPVLHLGGIINNATNNWTFQGRLDEVQIWNTARTASEIQQYMYQPLNGSESGLAAYYRMSDGAGTTLTDDSIYSWDGTLYDGTSSVPPDGSPPKWVTPGIF